MASRSSPSNAKAAAGLSARISSISRGAPQFPAFIRYTCRVTVRIRNGRTQRPVSFLFSGFAKHSSCELSYHALFIYRGPPLGYGSCRTAEPLRLLEAGEDL